MLNFITEIIQRFGARPAGSEAEKNAQLFVVEKCKTLTDNVQLLEFETVLNARFGKLKYYCAVYFIALLLYFVSPLAGFVFAFANVFVFVRDFMAYHTILGNFPGEKMKSWNVQATLEPQGKVKNTLLFSGHIDSVYEFKWWYKFGQWGMHLSLLAGLLFVLLPVFLLLAAVLPQGDWGLYVWFGFLALSPVLIVIFDMHGKNLVDGACDNLSGVAVAFEVFKNFADEKGKSTLKNTRLKFVSFGSEEPGLIGSEEFLKQKINELRNENAHIVNIDSIRLPEEICIIKKEIMDGTSFSKLLIEKIQESFRAKNIPIKTGVTPVGGTDGVFFVRAGLHAVSIIGIATDKLDFTYHTRRDVVENINPLALENVKNGLVEFVRQWDSV